MITDARLVPPGSTLVADVCVVGGGPLGIATALRLGAAGLDVLLLESGGLRPDGDVDDLVAPEHLDFGTVQALASTRRLGGNAHAWQVRTGPTWRGVRLMPFSPVDLEGRPEDPASTWPVSAHELTPYVAEAQKAFGLPSRALDPDAWAGPLGDQVLHGEDLETALFAFGNGSVFVDDGVAALAASERVRVYHHATAVEVLTDEDGSRATGVRVVTAPGRRLTATAGHVVLTAGAVPTTQLLLASDARHPGGLGNAYDHLGRNFMDHPLLDGGCLVPVSASDVSRRTLYDLRVVDGVPVMGHLRISADAIRRDGLPGLSTLVFPRRRGYQRREHLSARQLAGLRGALTVREALLRRQLPPVASVGRLALGLDGVVARAVDGRLNPVSSLGRGGWSAGPLGRLDVFDVVHQAEQPPHRDNRITLGTRQDWTGMRRVEVSWRWHAEDVAATMRAQEATAAALRRAGWGELELRRTDDGPVVRSSSSSHYMGTTRMSLRPQDGVVDPECAVHGVPNLFVASSSVFPSGGYANVTLTAMALALRVVDHVVARTGPVEVRAQVVAPEERTEPRPEPAPIAMLAFSTVVASMMMTDAGTGESTRPEEVTETVATAPPSQEEGADPLDLGPA